MVVVQLLFRWHEVDGTEHNIAQCGLTAQALLFLEPVILPNG